MRMDGLRNAGAVGAARPGSGLRSGIGPQFGTVFSTDVVGCGFLCGTGFCSRWYRTLVHRFLAKQFGQDFSDGPASATFPFVQRDQIVAGSNKDRAVRDDNHGTGATDIDQGFSEFLFRLAVQAGRWFIQ